MLLYDNKMKLRCMMQFRGSIFENLWAVALFELIYSYVLVILFPRYSALMDLLPGLKHSLALQSFGGLLAFAVCFRVKTSWSRYWEAMKTVPCLFGSSRAFDGAPLPSASSLARPSSRTSLPPIRCRFHLVFLAPFRCG